MIIILSREDETPSSTSTAATLPLPGMRIFFDDGGGNDVGGGDALHYRGDEHCLHWGWSERSAKARRD